jgi:hypothetical protein
VHALPHVSNSHEAVICVGWVGKRRHGACHSVRRNACVWRGIHHAAYAAMMQAGHGWPSGHGPWTGGQSWSSHTGHARIHTHTHTHTHTHWSQHTTHTHARTHTHTHARSHTHTHTHTHSLTTPHTHAHTHAHMHACIHTQHRLICFTCVGGGAVECNEISRNSSGSVSTTSYTDENNAVSEV